MSTYATDATIPADWDIADPTTWKLTSTVDAYDGEHGPSGGIYRRFTTITHDALEFDFPIPADQPRAALEEAAEWWAEVLIPIHEWACAEAEALPEEVAAAYTRANIDPEYPQPTDDLEDDAYTATRLLAALSVPKEESL